MTHSFEHSSAIEPIRSYFHRLQRILLTPRRFFREMPTGGGLSGPLAFALVTHWLASLVEHFWNGIVGERSLPFWGKLLGSLGAPDNSIDSVGRLPWFHHSRDLVMTWFWQAGPILVDPFLTLLKLLVLSIVIFMGARVVISSQKGENRITFESTLRILCFAMAANLIVLVPLIGTSLAWVFRLALTVLGILEVYQVSMGRALVVALFPYILMTATISIAFLGSAALVIRLLMSS